MTLGHDESVRTNLMILITFPPLCLRFTLLMLFVVDVQWTVAGLNGRRGLRAASPVAKVSRSVIVAVTVLTLNMAADIVSAWIATKDPVTTHSARVRTSVCLTIFI